MPALNKLNGWCLEIRKELDIGFGGSFSVAIPDEKKNDEQKAREVEERSLHGRKWLA